MARQGMDVERVAALAGQLEAQANAISGVVGVVDNAVGALATLWFGDNFGRFHSSWVTGQRGQADAAATDLASVVRDLRSQLDQQLQASGALGAVGTAGIAGPGSSSNPWGTGSSVDVNKHDPSVDLAQKDIRFVGTKNGVETYQEYNKKTGKWEDVTPPPGGFKPGVDVKIADVSGEAHLAKAEVNGKFDNGVVSGQGSAFAEAGVAQGSASVSAGKDGLKGSVDAALLVGAVGASGSLKSGLVSAKGGVEASVGAKAAASAHVGPTGVGVEGGAFAGAEANATGAVDVGGLGAQGGVGVQAGIGATGHADIGMEDGKFHIGAGGSVSLGVGLKVNVDITVDPAEIVHTAEDISHNVDNFVSNIDLNPFDW